MKNFDSYPLSMDGHCDVLNIFLCHGRRSHRTFTLPSGNQNYFTVQLLKMAYGNRAISTSCSSGPSFFGKFQKKLLPWAQPAPLPHKSQVHPKTLLISLCQVLERLPQRQSRQQKIVETLLLLKSGTYLLILNVTNGFQGKQQYWMMKTHKDLLTKAANKKN